MRIITILLIIIVITGLNDATAQKVISGKSSLTKLSLSPEYERGLPPNLYVEMTFEDDNNNLILEATESAKLILNISNKGKGAAQGLHVNVIDDRNDKNLKIGDGQEIFYVHPGKSVDVVIPLEAGFDIKTAEHKLEINVKEHFGYDMDPAYLRLTTLEYQKPKIEFLGLEIVDAGQGTAPLVQDGQLQAGEQVKMKIVLQNTGQNVSKNTTYAISTGNPNIYIEDGTGHLDELKIGEVKEFWITISPNKRVNNDDKLPVYLSVHNDLDIGTLNRFPLPVYLEKRPSEIVTMDVKADIDKLQKQVARFEYNSNRITTNLGNIIDIRQVPPSQTKRTNAIAILIGLEDYDYFAPAPYAENDADVMKEYFKNVLGINKILLYKSDDVTGYFFDNLFDPDLGELQKAVIQGQTDVFVYYSGHGIPNKMGDEVFLLPTDGRVEYIERQGYNINKFFHDLQALNANSITIFMDACFSGISRTSNTYSSQNLLSMKGVKIKPNISEPWASNENFSVFTSSDYDQTSLGYDDAETGLFTYYLCVGLQGKADENGDKQITAGELYDYVSTQVSETSSKIRGLQMPQFHGNRNTVLAEY
ncbi:MAG: caspase family protein [Bacteroidales bacterium]|nr:caspase family protein [Bacteroidales bacterium]